MWAVAIWPSMAVCSWTLFVVRHFAIIINDILNVLFGGFSLVSLCYELKIIVPRCTLPINSHRVPHRPVYTTITWNPTIKHLNLQPLLMKAAALITMPHPQHSNNSKQHIYLQQ